MLGPSIPEEESVLQAEAPHEFALSSQLYYEADRLKYSAQDPAAAEQKYREAMNATGSYGVFYHLAHGQLYSMRGNIEYALTEFEIASELNSDIPIVFINLGLTYRKMAGRLRSLNQIDKADAMVQESITVLQRVLVRHPDSVAAWSALAITFSKMGETYLADAERCVESARSLDPDNYEALTTLASLRSRTDKAAARQYALDAIALRPRESYPYGILGSRDARARLEASPQNALSWLEKGLLQQPEDPFLLSEIGKAYREMKDYPRAVEYFDRALKAQPEGHDSYGPLANRGNAYRLNGQFELAEADLQKSLSIRPDFNFALASLRDLFKSQKRHEEAFLISQSLCHQNARQSRPTTHYDPNIRQRDELQTLFFNDKRESIAITRRLITARADVYLDATMNAVEAALRLYSQNYDALGLKGRCLAARGKFAEARTLLDQALTLRPDAFFYRRILGQVLEDLGDWNAAQREYTACIKWDVRDEAAEDGLRRVQTQLRQEQRRKVNIEGAAIVFLNNKTGREERHPLNLIRDSLYDRMNDWNLPIRDVIEQIGNEPVFIIAKTGVGKTVTVPTKVLLGLCDSLLKAGADLAQRFPQVYVVEPRIPICTMTMAEMNAGYQDYVAYRMIDDAGFRAFLATHGGDIASKDRHAVSKIVELAYKYVATGKAPYDPHHFNLYGCITSASGKINGDAPILFVTTGIMESLTFDGTQLDPKYHRIIIDEAHVTIEANPSIELGIALARKRGVRIDYMSATVDPATLHTDLGVKIVYAEAQRFPIHLTNLNATVEESILGLVKNFLVEADGTRFPSPGDFSNTSVRARVERVRLHLLSKDRFEDDGRMYPGLKDRPQGMLVIVNSHQSENSDTHRIADIIARADFNRPKTVVHTLRLASPIVRDPSQKLAFDRKIKHIEDQNGRYVIVATNVVEMGLTFASIDYVVTMDSEFETTFVDGGELTTKVELGVNALYQRIGRAGRVRPGMAFIARDLGASYTQLNDESLAAGLKEAPIRYPLAKGSFLKLALYSFREGIPERALRQRITDLNLPSRIQDNDELWDRFLTERRRLRAIGIAEGDRLSSVGKQSLGFIGLDDMDFAVLLATVIERYGIKSDLAAIFTVMAATSEIGFSQLMAKRYFLMNTRQLSAVELFDEAMLGVPVTEVFNVVRRHEGNCEALSAALQASSVDDQLSSDICACVRAGYRLAGPCDESDRQVPAPEMVSESARDSDEADYAVGDEWGATDDDTGDDQLFKNLTLQLDQCSPERTLAFERAVVSLSNQSDLINIYRIFRHFFNSYFCRLKSSSLSDLEKSELHKSMEEEASKLQVSMPALKHIDDRFKQLARHVEIQLVQDEGQRVLSSSLNDDERDMLRVSIVRDLLFEREGDDDRLDLCLRFYKLAQERRFTPRDSESMAKDLQSFGHGTTGVEVKELWNLIVKEARRRYEQQCRLLDCRETREVLPPISKGLEIELLRVLRDCGYHRRLSFRKSDLGYSAVVTDQLGKGIEVTMPRENNPLAMGFDGRDTITVFAKLTPAMIPKVVRDEESDGDFIKQEEQGYRLSHVTLVN